MGLAGFAEERRELNELVLGRGTLVTKRFFSLDSQAYRRGALDVKTKELLGLVASTVLRCDDCIRYHVVRLASLGLGWEEFAEAMDVALVVGGTITIPHIRRAYRDFREALELREKGMLPALE